MSKMNINENWWKKNLEELKKDTKELKQIAKEEKELKTKMMAWLRHHHIRLNMHWDEIVRRPAR